MNDNIHHNPSTDVLDDNPNPVGSYKLTVNESSTTHVESHKEEKTSTWTEKAEDDEEVIDLDPPKPIKENTPLPTPKEEEVDRAFAKTVGKTALKQIKEKEEEETCCLGEILHNPYLEYDQSVEDWVDRMTSQGEGFINIPSLTPDDFYKSIQKRPNVEVMVDDEGNDMSELVKDSYLSMPRDGVYANFVKDDKRYMTQEVNYQTPEGSTVKLRAGKPRFKSSINKTLTGESAVIRLESLTGTGGLFTFPLWHSGFWVTLKTPSDLKIIDLEYEILKAKTYLGRSLGGSIFSNDQVYLSTTVLKIFKESIFKTTLVNEDDLFKKIKLHDLQTIAWGLACAIWSNGYNYSRAIISENGFSDRVVRGKLDLTKLLWVDYNALSEKQIKAMARKSGSGVSDTDLEHYANGFKLKQEVKVDLGKGLTVTLKHPSIEEHIKAGEEWCTNISTTVNDLGTVETDEDREELVVRYAKATLMNQYRHYVKEISYTNDDFEESYQDEETIIKLLDRFSTKSEIRTKFMKGVLDFIDNSSVSIIATPTVEEEESKLLERFPNLVPMDALYTFFRLAMQRANLLRRRRVS